MTEKVCRKCGHVNNGWRCENCGEVLPLNADEFFCSKCGKQLGSGHSFSSDCEYGIGVQILLVEAESMNEVWKERNIKIPKDFTCQDEVIIHQGSPETVTVSADTIDQAFLAAQSRLPDNAKETSRQVLQVPDRKLFAKVALDEESAIKSARWEARVNYGFSEEARVENVRLSVIGSKGILGIGKRPNQYELTLLSPAIVCVTYIPKVKVVYKLVRKDEMESHYGKLVDSCIMYRDWENCIGYGERAIDPLIDELLYSGFRYSYEERQKIISALGEITKTNGGIGVMRPRLYCKVCRSSFRREDASTYEYDYDIGDEGRTRKIFSCPTCGAKSKLFDSLGNEYSEITQH